MSTDVAANLNNLAAQRLAEGGAKPLTGGGGALNVALGVNTTDTQIGGGHFQDTQGVPGGTIHGLGSLLTSKKGDGPIAKALREAHGALSKMSAEMHETLKASAANGNIGSGAGGIDRPMSTPMPVAANDRNGGASLSA